MILRDWKKFDCCPLVWKREREERREREREREGIVSQKPCNFEMKHRENSVSNR